MTNYEEVVNLALRRGLFFPASEIYQNAPAGFYDFGPYGASIRRKIIEVWRKTFVQAEDMLEIDGAITMPVDVFKASGHLEDFNDPMTQCKKCKTILRADQLLEEKGEEVNEGTPIEELTKKIKKLGLKCTKCKGELMDVRQFNLMVKAIVGSGNGVDCYLRPETCQSIFTSWDRLKSTCRIKLPKGIAQVGKAFRNEISPRQTIIRCVEFYQMEAEIFFDPAQINEVENFDEVKDYKVQVLLTSAKKVQAITAKKLVDDKIVSGKLIAYYMARTQQLYERYGMPIEKLRFRQVQDDERAFYAKEGWDLEVETSVGWIELGPINYRTDYDIGRHKEISGKDISYVNDDGSKLIPHVLEISLGVERAVYCALELAYRKTKDRMWLALPPKIAPIEIGVCPLLKNKPELVAKAKEIFKEIKCCYECEYDAAGSIGKRYARFDEVGVPWCLTIDFDSLTNNDVTIRDRDTAEQKRIKIDDLKVVFFRLLTGVNFSEV
jgi:glycyl-tRNA synthetase